MCEIVFMYICMCVYVKFDVLLLHDNYRELNAESCTCIIVCLMDVIRTTDDANSCKLALYCVAVQKLRPECLQSIVSLRTDVY